MIQSVGFMPSILLGSPENPIMKLVKRTLLLLNSVKKEAKNMGVKKINDYILVGA